MSRQVLANQSTETSQFNLRPHLGYCLRTPAVSILVFLVSCLSFGEQQASAQQTTDRVIAPATPKTAAAKAAISDDILAIRKTLGIKLFGGKSDQAFQDSIDQIIDKPAKVKKARASKLQETNKQPTPSVPEQDSQIIDDIVKIRKHLGGSVVAGSASDQDMKAVIRHLIKVSPQAESYGLPGAPQNNLPPVRLPPPNPRDRTLPPVVSPGNDHLPPFNRQPVPVLAPPLSPDASRMTAISAIADTIASLDQTAVSLERVGAFDDAAKVRKISRKLQKQLRQFFGQNNRDN